MDAHSNLYVYGLPAGIDDATLRSIFEGTGTILSVKCISDRRYGFVKYASPEEAQNAIITLNGQICYGSRITVQFANRDTQGKGGGGGLAGGVMALAAAPTIDITIPSEDIFVKGLPPNLTQEQVKAVFEMYGVVQTVHVANADTADGVGESIALIKMKDTETATWMVANLNGNIPQGLEKPLLVSFATNPAAVQQQKSPIDLSANRYSPYGKGTLAQQTVVLPNGQSVSIDAASVAAATGTQAGAVMLPTGQTVALGGAGLAAANAAALAALGGQVAPSPGKGFKTRLCIQYADTGMCPRGDQCTFAHGGHEVKGFRTKLCKFSAGTCPSGDKCSFAHTGSEVRGYKSRMCKYDARLCPQGDKCSFAHSAYELQLGTLAQQGGATGAAAAAGAAGAATAGVGGMTTEALIGMLGSLNTNDIGGLAALGIDINALLGLSSANIGTAGVAQPELLQAAMVATQPDSMASLGSTA